MIKVFIGGSRRASRLNSQVRDRLDNIIERGLIILIGDANGADKAVQRYLQNKRYESVEVFCSDGICRNNVGNWLMRNVPVHRNQRGVEYYSEKDRMMAREAELGFMIWDGKSIGTLLNVYRLIHRQKISVMYVAPEKRFITFRRMKDWEEFITTRDGEVQRKFVKRAKLETISQNQRPQLTMSV